MKSTNQELESQIALVEAAFSRFTQYTPDLNPTTDNIFAAVVLAGYVEMVPHPSGTLNVKVGNCSPVEVPAKISNFRTILARIATICYAASEKKSIWGRLRARLRAAGILADFYETETGNHRFKYRKCSMPSSRGEHLYALEAVLDLSDTHGQNHRLKIKINNTLDNLLLRLERLEVN